METATFAGGCFWCMEPPFEKLDGVAAVVSGYTGGTGADPTYDDYAQKGHVEAVQVTYDPTQITYAQLLQVFWRQIDPTDAGGQFVDRGPQYRSAIFYHDEEQKRLAEESKEELAASGRFDKPIVTEILPASKFYPAEDYHQDYYEHHSIRYKFYRSRSGRDAFLDKVWGKDREVKLEPPAGQAFAKPSEAELKQHADSAAVRGDAGGGHRAGLPQRLLGQPPGRASTWTSSRASRSSRRSTSSSPAPAGRASRGRWRPRTSSRRRTAACS